jgi:hypothetical protein
MRRFALAAAVPLLLAAVATTAEAQGRGNKGKGGHPHGMPPGQAKKHVTPDHAVDVTRIVLVEQGYTIVRVERVSGTQVVYYRRGKKGEIQRIFVRPAAETVVVERAPQPVLLQVNLRLGL